MPRTLTRFTLILIAFLAATLILCCITVLPALAQQMAVMHPDVAYLRYPILLGLYATALPCLYAMYEASCIVRSMTQQAVPKQLTPSFTAIFYCALTIVALYMIGLTLLASANALPPLLALIGIGIIAVTLLIACGTKLLQSTSTAQQA